MKTITKLSKKSIDFLLHCELDVKKVKLNLYPKGIVVLHRCETKTEINENCKDSKYPYYLTLNKGEIK